MADKQIIDDVDILYICSYGQTALPICVDLEHRYCKLKSQKSKKCNLRPVVSYKEYKRKEQECEELNSDNRYFVNKIISLELLTDKYEQAIGKIEDIADDYNRVEKTSQYYRDGFDEIQNIIDEIKEGNNDR